MQEKINDLNTFLIRSGRSKAVFPFTLPLEENTPESKSSILTQKKEFLEEKDAFLATEDKKDTQNNALSMQASKDGLLATQTYQDLESGAIDATSTHTDHTITTITDSSTGKTTEYIKWSSGKSSYTEYDGSGNKIISYEESLGGETSYVEYDGSGNKTAEYRGLPDGGFKYSEYNPDTGKESEYTDFGNGGFKYLEYDPDTEKTLEYIEWPDGGFKYEESYPATGVKTFYREWPDGGFEYDWTDASGASYEYSKSESGETLAEYNSIGDPVSKQGIVSDEVREDWYYVTSYVNGVGVVSSRDGMSFISPEEELNVVDKSTPEGIDITNNAIDSVRKLTMSNAEVHYIDVSLVGDEYYDIALREAQKYQTMANLFVDDSRYKVVIVDRNTDKEELLDNLQDSEATFKYDTMATVNLGGDSGNAPNGKYRQIPGRQIALDYEMDEDGAHHVIRHEIGHFSTLHGHSCNCIEDSDVTENLTGEKMQYGDVMSYAHKRNHGYNDETNDWLFEQLLDKVESGANLTDEERDIMRQMIDDEMLPLMTDLQALYGTSDRAKEMFPPDGFVSHAMRNEIELYDGKVVEEMDADRLQTIIISGLVGMALLSSLLAGLYLYKTSSTHSSVTQNEKSQSPEDTTKGVGEEGVETVGEEVDNGVELARKIDEEGVEELGEGGEKKDSSGASQTPNDNVKALQDVSVRDSDDVSSMVPLIHSTSLTQKHNERQQSL